jgi:transcriptional regulator PpsR
VTELSSTPDDLGALSEFAPELANLFVSLSGGIALIMGQDGVIRNVAVSASITEPSASAWIGRPWAETVTGDTRKKIELLIQEVGTTGFTRKREVNHPASGGTDIPISYSALRLGKQGPVIAVGRDLRTISAIQQQMLSAQKDLERDYWTLRRDQGQQRELDQVASDAVLVVAGPDFRVHMHNAAAAMLLMPTDSSLCPQVLTLLAKARQSGKAVEVRTRLKTQGPDSHLFDLFVTPFRGQVSDDDGDDEDGAKRLLVRARQVGKPDDLPAATCTAITDTQGRILMASDALIALCADAGSGSLYGMTLSSLLDNGQGVLAGLLPQVLQNGMAHVASTFLGGHGTPVCEAEISATLINDGDQERIGYCLRVQNANAKTGDTWTQSLQSLAASQLPLAELLQQVQLLTEQHAISEALRSTGAQLSASASLLGLSVADLEQRLARLGLDRARYTAH